MAPLVARTATHHRTLTRRPGIIFFLLLLILAIPLRIYASPVTVPIKLDYPLLRLLLIKQLFNTPDQSTEIINDPSGCSQIVLTNPQLGEKQASLEIVTEVKARLGIGVFGNCTTLLQWQGSAGFLGRPVIQPGATSVRLEPVDSWLVASDGRKITSGRIWDLAKDRFQPLFSRFKLDLTPAINTLGMILPEVLAHRSSQQLQTIVSSLRLRDLQVAPTRLDVFLSFQVEELVEQPQPASVLSPQELQQWEGQWQMMDALFTFAVKYYASTTNHRELHSTLLEILLDSRYRLRDALTVPASRSNDPVRRWFLDSWKRLSPVIRRIGLEQTGQEPLLWISLLTATDALDALDRLGPSIGLDISANGLRRLARLINEETEVDPLSYDQAVDPELQQLFQLPFTLNLEQPSGFRFDPWSIRFAWADSSTDRLDRWVPNKDQLGIYLPLVASLLNTTAARTLKKKDLTPPVVKLFQNLVLAAAWQESCWRQYVVSKKKIVPLRSNTGDVGLMQINEKVWRGFYDIQKLRWDIAYNSRAGTEVLLNYLTKYALKQGEHQRSGGLDNLARASYSAYNGGPSQIARYRKHNVASTHRKVDAAFWGKYQQVKAGNELNVAQCLGGEATNQGNAQPTAKMDQATIGGKKKEVAASTVTTNAGERWVRVQKENRFTLQLAVFSKQASARKFIKQQSLSGQIGIYPIRKGQTTQFAVLYGSYAKRTEADKAKQRLKHLKPWVRQFGELRKAGRP